MLSSWMDDRLIAAGLTDRIREAGAGFYDRRWRGGPVLEPDCKIYAVQEGSADYAVEDSGRWRRTSLRAGDVALIPGGRRHRYRTARGWRLRWMHVPIIDAELQAALASCPGILRLRADEHADALAGMAVLEEKADHAALPHQLALQGVAATLLAAALSLRPPRGRDPDPEMTRLRRWCDAHCLRHPDREAVAAAAHLSVAQLHRRFTAAFGQTPHAYLERRRIEQAQRLLRRGDLSVAAVAEACGYRDPYYFSRVFRHRVGLAPSAYAACAQQP